MATNIITTINAYIANDAEYRAFWKTFSDFLIASGFVKTADTGQIDYTTALKPTASSTFPAGHFEIFRSNDAGGGLTNYFFKLEYGSGGSSFTPALRITVGWSTNGAGTINSAGTIQATLNPAATPPTNTAYPMYLFAIGAEGCCAISYNGTSTTQSVLWSLERTRNAAGVLQNEVCLATQVITGAVETRVLPASGAPPLAATSNNFIAPVNGGGAAAAFGNEIGVGFLFPAKGSHLPPSTNLLIGDLTNFPSTGFAYSISTFGMARNYITMPNPPNPAGSGNPRFLMRFE